MRLAYGAVQRRATLDHVIESLSDRAAERIDAPVLAALRLGVHQLLFMDGVADHAAVDGVRRPDQGGTQPRARFRERGAAADRTGGEGGWWTGSASPRPRRPRCATRTREWVAQAWWDQLGPRDAVDLMRTDNEPAESAARVNTLRATRDDVLAELAGAGRRGTRRAATSPRESCWRTPTTCTAPPRSSAAR